MSPTNFKVTSIYCICCDYTAKTKARYMQHLGTTKHGRNYLKYLNKTEKEKENVLYCKVADKPVQEKIKIVEDEPVQEESPDIVDNPVQEKQRLEDTEEEFVQEFNLDTLALYYQQKMNTISIPKVFIWFIHIFFAMRTFFGYNRQNIPQNHLSGNE